MSQNYKDNCSNKFQFLSGMTECYRIEIFNVNPDISKYYREKIFDNLTNRKRIELKYLYKQNYVDFTTN